MRNFKESKMIMPKTIIKRDAERDVFKNIALKAYKKGTVHDDHADRYFESISEADNDALFVAVAYHTDHMDEESAINAWCYYGMLKPYSRDALEIMRVSLLLSKLPEIVAKWMCNYASNVMILEGKNREALEYFLNDNGMIEESDIKGKTPDELIAQIKAIVEEMKA
jgi:hypothetical protein